jgi:hypothetical protein
VVWSYISQCIGAAGARLKLGDSAKLPLGEGSGYRAGALSIVATSASTRRPRAARADFLRSSTEASSARALLRLRLRVRCSYLAFMDQR